LITYLLTYLNFASSDSEISENSENNNIADDTDTGRLTEGNKSTYTAPKPENVYN